MFGTIVEHFNFILVFAGIAGLCTGGYQIWWSNDRRLQHHLAIISAFDWIARAGWLDMMQRGVCWLLSLLDRLYGPPRDGRPDRFSGMLTTRSWQASAWIASFILFALPFAILTIALPVVAKRGGRPIEWEGSVVMAGIFILLCGVFVLLVRRVWSRQTSNTVGALHRDIVIDASGMAIGVHILLAIIYLGSVLAPPASSGTSRKFTLFSVDGALALLALSMLIGLLVFYIVKSLRRYGFMAPAIFSLIFTLSLLCAACSVAGLISIASGKTTMWTMWAGCIAGVCGIGFMALRFVNVRSSIVRYFPIVIGSVLACGTIFTDPSVTTTMAPADIFRGAIGILIWMTVPYVFAAYAAVYSNSLPDWLSVAATRHILYKATLVSSIRSFLVWLMIDAVVAITCIVATLLILVIVFQFCGTVIQLAGYIGNLGNTSNSAATFFFGSSQSITVIYGVMNGHAVNEITTVDPQHASGALLVAMLVALGATSILPTLLNAVVLLVLIVSRATALLTQRPIRYLHAMLVMPVGAPPETSGLLLLRSSIVVGILFTAGLTAIHVVLIQLWHIAAMAIHATKI